MQGDRIAGVPTPARSAAAPDPAPWSRMRPGVGHHRNAHQDLTFEAYAQRWIEEYSGRTNRGLDDSTRHDYRRSLERHALPTLGTLALHDVAPRDIRGLITALEHAGQAPSSVKKHIAPVRAMLATAVEEGL